MLSFIYDNDYDYHYNFINDIGGNEMNKVLVVYWSGTGNTEMMAESIAKGISEAGSEVVVKSVSDAQANEVEAFDYIAFGCPSMGAEVLEESEFEPFFSDVEDKLGNKKVALFGSYGWGDGEWMRDWESRVSSKGASLYKGEGLIINSTPDDSALADCVDFGKGFMAF